MLDFVRAILFSAENLFIDIGLQTGCYVDLLRFDALKIANRNTTVQKWIGFHPDRKILTIVHGLSA